MIATLKAAAVPLTVLAAVAVTTAISRHRRRRKNRR